MQEIRLVERRDKMLIFETDEGDQFSLTVTEEIIQAVQSIQRSLAHEAQSETPPIRPREIQALLREGTPRTQVAEQLNISDEDVERYATPIEAEFQFILSQARSVPVRASIEPDSPPEQFGEVIEERLEKLQTDSFEWSTWRDTQDGWMVLLRFSSRGVDHEAKWMYDHKKRLLNPVTPDAVNLSKQGDVGDKLIPTLRAVDAPNERGFENDAFDVSPEPSTQDNHPDGAAEEPASIEEHDPQPQVDEYERRRGIEERAIATAPEERDLGETSDLLDALRKRRQERDGQPQETPSVSPEKQSHSTETPSSSAVSDDAGEETTRPTINIWKPPAPPADEARQTATPSTEQPAPKTEERKTKKGRTSIPSWDEILFGARGDED